MATPNIAELKQRLHQLYFVNHARRGANDWLQNYRHSPEAWELSLQLLQAPDSSHEERVFSAQTLHWKAKKKNELTEAQVADLQQRVLGLLQQYSQVATQRVVVTQLCLVLSALLLRCADWSLVQAEGQPIARPLADLMAILQQQSSALYVVQALSMLPEVIVSKNLSIAPSQRESTRQSLQISAPAVLGLLPSLLQNQEEKHRVAIVLMQCVEGWIALGMHHEDFHNRIIIPSFTAAQLTNLGALQLAQQWLFSDA